MPTRRRALGVARHIDSRHLTHLANHRLVVRIAGTLASSIVLIVTQSLMTGRPRLVGPTGWRSQAGSGADQLAAVPREDPLQRPPCNDSRTLAVRESILIRLLAFQQDPGCLLICPDEVAMIKQV